MDALRVGFIGTGKDPEKPGRTGYAMAYRHAAGYRALGERCNMVACADIVRENAEAFAQRNGVPTVYTDYSEMLAREALNMVSVCTWPHLHEQMVVDCAEAGVRAVHCEKPMARTWGGAKRMARVCEERGVQLTFNHMRRFGGPFRRAKELLDAGEVGRPVLLQYGEANLYDGGTHHIDMAGYFNDQTPAEWAICQIDYTRESLVFGAHNENAALALWKYANGVYGQCVTGRAGREVVGAYDRIVGSDGVIEVGPFGQDMPLLRVKARGSGSWEAVDCEGDGLHGPGYHERGIAQAVQCLEDGTTSELCAANALQATEIIFACWESVRRRGLVHMPLDIEDNPLEEMVASGELKPEKR
jgi:predicted dehydrogenase